MPYADAADRRAYEHRREARRRAESDDYRQRDNARREERRKRQWESDPRTHEAYNQMRREGYRAKRGPIVEEIPFLAYDGEGIANRYVLLANSREYIADKKVLGIDECLEFLTRDYDDNPFRVFFAMDYDVTKIVQGLDADRLAELSAKSRTHYGPYVITHYPGKMLRIRRRGEKRTYVYYDVWGFFQKSFLAVVEEYEAVGLPIDDASREVIEWGKRERVQFTLKDWRKMIRYNNTECVLLEAIMQRLRGALYSAGMRPLQWHGPGVVAEILLDRGRSRKYVEKTFNTDALRRAYYGGRIEVLKRGRIEGPIYDYDIRSAYPHALATYARPAGPYRSVTSHVPSQVGLFEVVWNVGDAANPTWNTRAFPERPCIIGPFPYRSRNGSISFPPIGRGIYHAVEVDAAVRMYGEATAAGEPGIYVERGSVAAKGEQPFALLITQWYDKRLEYLRVNDITNIAYKLGLNSAYGKLAQRVGKRKHGDLFLAGHITAATRAMLLDAVAGNAEHIVSFATDGVLSRVELPVPAINEGDSLGDWEGRQWDAADVLMSGIYRLQLDDEWMTIKSRGWKALDFDDAITVLDGGEGEQGILVPNRAFVTYKMAVHSHKAYGPRIGQFIERTRRLNPQTEQKRNWYLDGERMFRGMLPFGGFGAGWTTDVQRSIARPLLDDAGEPLSWQDIEPSWPLKDTNKPSEDVWALAKEDAEQVYLLDSDGIELAAQSA